MASFHPHAAANATSGIKHARGRAMAIFISSGTVGLALGPAVFSAICGRWGLTAGAFAALFGILITALLFIFLKPAPASAGLVRARFEWAPLRAVARPLTILYLLVFVRSVVQIVFTQFLPLYLKTQRGFSLTGASYSLSLFLIAGALGGVAGGHLADRFGGKRVIVISMLGAVPLLALFLFTSGWLSTVALFLCGLVLLFTVPVNVVMAQRLAPGQMGTVSALMMGFSWGMAGVIFIPLIGWIADHSSLQFAFTALVAFPLIGFVLALRLKIPATA